MRQPDALPEIPSERLIGHNVLVASGTIAAGVLGFTFQVLISHRLAPSDYGAVFAAMSVLTLVALPASALTLLMARETSRDRATGHSAASVALLRSGNRTLLVAGVVLGLLFAVGSPWIGAFFSVPAAFVVAVAAGMPVALALPLLIGALTATRTTSKRVPLEKSPGVVTWRGRDQSVPKKYPRRSQRPATRSGASHERLSLHHGQR